MTKMFSKYDKNDKFISPGKSKKHKKEILYQDTSYHVVQSQW